MKKQLLALVALGALISGTQLFGTRRCLREDKFKEFSAKFGCTNFDPTDPNCQKVCCKVRDLPVKVGEDIPGRKCSVTPCACPADCRERR